MLKALGSVVVASAMVFVTSAFSVQAAAGVDANDTLEQTVEEYAQKIAQTYFDEILGAQDLSSSEGSLEAYSMAGRVNVSQQSNAEKREDALAGENGAADEISTRYGLVAQEAQVDSSIVSTEKQGLKYSVVADLTTHVQYAKKDGYHIVIAGQERDTLDSSYTDRHIMVLQAEEGEMHVVSDEIVLPSTVDSQDIEELNQTAEIKGAQQSQWLEPSSERTIVQPAANMSVFTNSAGLNYIDAINYAEYWTEDVRKDSMNPEYPDLENNSTNFVSQALHEGGLSYKGNASDYKKNEAWFSNSFTKESTSYTWGAAENNYQHMLHHSGSFTYESNADKAWQGSIIYGDWDANGTKDHAMLVVGYIGRGDDFGPVICQKEDNQHNKAFAALKKDTARVYPEAIWTALQYKYE